MQSSQVNFASGQVDFQLTCPDGLVEILEKNYMVCWPSGIITIFAMLCANLGRTFLLIQY